MSSNTANKGGGKKAGCKNAVGGGGDFNRDVDQKCRQLVLLAAKNKGNRWAERTSYSQAWGDMGNAASGGGFFLDEGQEGRSRVGGNKSAWKR